MAHKMRIQDVLSNKGASVPLTGAKVFNGVDGLETLEMICDSERCFRYLYQRKQLTGRTIRPHSEKAGY